MSEIPKCKKCGEQPYTRPFTTPRGWSAVCTTIGCWNTPIYPTEAEADAAWAAMMRPPGPTVEWTTRRIGGSEAVYVTDVDNVDFPTPLNVSRFGPGADVLLAGPCTLTVAVVPTEAEPIREDKPDDTIPVPGGHVWLYRRHQELATIVSGLAGRLVDLESRLSAQHERLDRHDMAVAKLAEGRGDAVREAVGKILTVYEPPETAEPADSVEPDEPKTQTVQLFHANGHRVGEHEIEAGFTPHAFRRGPHMYVRHDDDTYHMLGRYPTTWPGHVLKAGR